MKSSSRDSGQKTKPIYNLFSLSWSRGKKLPKCFMLVARNSISSGLLYFRRKLLQFEWSKTLWNLGISRFISLTKLCSPASFTRATLYSTLDFYRDRKLQKCEMTSSLGGAGLDMECPFFICYYFHTAIKYKSTVCLRLQIAKADRGGRSYT